MKIGGEHMPQELLTSSPETVIHDFFRDNFNYFDVLEEAANALTHGAGLLLGVSALTHILHVLPLQLTVRQTAGVLTYSISLVLMFLASTLYHAVSQIRVKQILKRCDHCAIYLLIAGTATPLLTIAVQNSAASILLIVIWSMAAVGVGFKLFWLPPKGDRQQASENG